MNNSNTSIDRTCPQRSTNGLYNPCHLSLNITASLFTKLVFFFFKSTLLKCLNRVSLSVPAHTPELHVMNYTDNQPLTPEEQFALMDLHEKEISKREKQPSSDDLEVFILFLLEVKVAAVIICKLSRNCLLKGS